jgi:hypothetical protein
MKHRINIKGYKTKEEYWELIKFCNDQFGPSFMKTKKRKRNKWSCSFNGGMLVFTFRDPKHASTFALFHA